MRIGVDLGGTKIEAVALDRDGQERGRRRVPTPRGRYGATLAAITTLVEGLERESGEPARVGIGMPGALSPATGLVKNANSVWLNGRPLRQDLERLLHRPLRFANDANCFALSEARDGAGAGAAVVFGVILGTGTGGGVVVHGRVLGGPNAVAGEWGHNPLPWPRAGEWPGAACYCGRTGCVETFLSGPGVSRDHREATGEELDAMTIAARAADGDAACEATLARYEERLARALADGGQSPGPGRDRARRRPLEPDPALRGGARALGRVGVLGPRRHGPPSSEARRLERRPGSRVALGRGRGRREAEPVAAAYRLTPVRRLANAVVRGLVGLGAGPGAHLSPDRPGASKRPGAIDAGDAGRERGAALARGALRRRWAGSATRARPGASPCHAGGERRR